MPIRRSPNDARHPIHRVVAITRNRWSRSIGMTGRNQSERLVAIIRYAQPAPKSRAGGWQRSDPELFALCFLGPL